MSELLVAERISVVYGSGPERMHALRDISLRFSAGEVATITGPSGSGKTTLLAVLGLLRRPDAGGLHLSGELVSGLGEARAAELRRRHIGFIFQAFRLLHALTALENVALALELGGVGRARAVDRARRALADVGLAHKCGLRPANLSGGEKQRVAIARALAPGPRILLADEPTASLDADSGAAVTQLLMGLASEERVVIVVTHDPRWMQSQAGRRVIRLRDGSVES